ncbi:uncharacterized protein LOC127595093 [Hippocampus zosterae]|uniref:uncharacterized protein LOC127595093 n=1 Tax=Hippocampus zosterae TaxID=109293 RepID=UPI00223CBAA2|nr:uncharacterized protein LOC127595093 [Hippocampus zosterae]
MGLTGKRPDLRLYPIELVVRDSPPRILELEVSDPDDPRAAGQHLPHPSRSLPPLRDRLPPQPRLRGRRATVPQDACQPHDIINVRDNMFRKKVETELDPETLRELELAFKLYDDRGIGSISGADLKSVMRAFGFPVKKAAVRDLLKRANLEYEDPISLASFIAVMGEVLPKRHSKEHYERIFKLFDTENRGKISPEMVAEVAESVGEYISNDHLNLIFERGDLDHDGALNFQEFTALVNPRREDE